ncbi:MAG: hypothetical protein EU547_04300 [Promethearchaeota archaeon]|nr:MAG: hypothetical protein EU547_04300 [Candidatus Lokiarchaeota archaeon]
MFHGQGWDWRVLFGAGLISPLIFFFSLVYIHFWIMPIGICLGYIGITIRISNYIYVFRTLEFSGFTITFFYDLIPLMCITCLITLLTIIKIKEAYSNPTLIKKTILELGTKFPRLKIKEISEECGKDQDLIIKVVKDMIRNEEIYADYFKSSNSVLFDQQANIREINDLMEVYKDWDHSNIKKNKTS